MNTESVRQFCLSLPRATEQVQWGADLVFKVGGKMFAVAALEPGGNVLSFKTTPESFYELQETEGIVAAPYLARAQWVALQSFSVLRDSELKELLTTSYRLVFEKLTKRQQAELSAAPAEKKSFAKKAAKKTPKKTGKK